MTSVDGERLLPVFFLRPPRRRLVRTRARARNKFTFTRHSSSSRCCAASAVITHQHVFHDHHHAHKRAHLHTHTYARAQNNTNTATHTHTPTGPMIICTVIYCSHNTRRARPRVFSSTAANNLYKTHTHTHTVYIYYVGHVRAIRFPQKRHTALWPPLPHRWGFSPPSNHPRNAVR